MFDGEGYGIVKYDDRIAASQTLISSTNTTEWAAKSEVKSGKTA